MIDASGVSPLQLAVVNASVTSFSLSVLGISLHTVIRDALCWEATKIELLV